MQTILEPIASAATSTGDAFRTALVASNNNKRKFFSSQNFEMHDANNVFDNNRAAHSIDCPTMPHKLARLTNATPANETALTYSHLVQEFCGENELNDPDAVDSGDGVELMTVAEGGATISYVLYDSGFLSMMGDGEEDDDKQQQHHQPKNSAQQLDEYSAERQHNSDDHELRDLLDLDRRQLFFESNVTEQRQPHAHPQPSEITINTSQPYRSSLTTNTTTNTDGEFFRCNNAVDALDADQDRNLSWLFNFKLDELPHLSPEVNSCPINRHQTNSVDNQTALTTPPSSSSSSSSPSSTVSTGSGRSKRRRNSSGSNSGQHTRADIRNKVDEIIKEATAMEAKQLQRLQLQQQQQKLLVQQPKGASEAVGKTQQQQQSPKFPSIGDGAEDMMHIM